MCEILFRGKRIDNGAWIIGHLLRYEDGRARINPSHTDIFCYAADRNTIQTVAYEVDPETVGQHTGLTDKNGKKIFEGDILRCAYHPSQDVIVKWHDGAFRFRKRIYPKEYGYEAICCNQSSVKHLKVIGNIHDNPELLGGGENAAD